MVKLDIENEGYESILEILFLILFLGLVLAYHIPVIKSCFVLTGENWRKTEFSEDQMDWLLILGSDPILDL